MEKWESRVWMSTPVGQEQHIAFTSVWKTLSHSSPSFTLSVSFTHTHTQRLCSESHLSLERKEELGGCLWWGMEDWLGDWLVGSAWLGEVWVGVEQRTTFPHPQYVHYYIPKYVTRCPVSSLLWLMGTKIQNISSWERERESELLQAWIFYMKEHALFPSLLLQRVKRHLYFLPRDNSSCAPAYKKMKMYTTLYSKQLSFTTILPNSTRFKKEEDGIINDFLEM